VSERHPSETSFRSLKRDKRRRTREPRNERGNDTNRSSSSYTRDRNGHGNDNGAAGQDDEPQDSNDWCRALAEGAVALFEHPASDVPSVARAIRESGLCEEEVDCKIREIGQQATAVNRVAVLIASLKEAAAEGDGTTRLRRLRELMPPRYRKPAEEVMAEEPDDEDPHHPSKYMGFAGGDPQKARELAEEARRKNEERKRSDGDAAT